MGSGNSRMESRPAGQPRASHRNKFGLASLLCGTSFPEDPPQMEDQPDDVLASPDSVPDSMVVDNLQNLMKGSSPFFFPENSRSSSTSENATLCQSRNGSLEEIYVDYDPRNAESSDSGKYTLKSKELVSCWTNADFHLGETSSDRLSDQASTSTRPLPFESLSPNMDAGLPPIVEVENFAVGLSPQTCTEKLPSGSISQCEAGNLPASGIFSVGNQAEEVPGVRSSDSNSISAISDSPVTWQPLGEEPIQETPSLDSQYFTPIRPWERRSGSVLHVDVVSISSNIVSRDSGDVSNREARRNSRRLFWDAFSRSSRRNYESPSIIFSTDDTDDLSSHDRWLLDFSSDILDHGIREGPEFLNHRHDAEEQGLNSRSEIWERLHSDLDGNSGHSTLCASGLHPDGTCSCETFLMTEGSRTHASISRIVMLAEALFEVLDEIHRQPVPLSLSMVSHPASDSVVNSFPLKSFKKLNIADSGDGAEQCYICLAEYEEGDKIRVLPCRHEYHMSCVDKWLKEIHGVCPLCRGDVSHM